MARAPAADAPRAFRRRVDHRYFGEGPPILFETMIIGGPLNNEQWRYSSWDDAETGHQAAVRKARQAMAKHESD